jgi:two-component system, OmpR family, sensor kinase
VKIRWRLTWYGIGFTALSLAVFIVVINLLVVGSAQQDQDDLLSQIADEAAGALTDVDSSQLTQPVLPAIPDASNSDQPFFTVYDEEGTVYYATGTVEGAPLDLPAAVVVEALEDGASSANVSGVRVQVRRWESPSVGGGVVAASQSEEVIAEQLRGLRWFLVVFGVIALLAAAIGAWLMAGRALRPLKLLAVTTDDIGSTGDLSRRLPPVKHSDEVGTLTDSFNTMLDGIEAARRDRDLIIDAQKRFVADASHELRSPLTSIRANAGFLLDRADASIEDRLDATSDISTEADRMSDLIDDLLTLARADLRADDTSDFAPVDLAGVARSVERRARNLEIEFTVDAPDSLIVSGNANDLAELLWILVDNADRHGAARAKMTVHSTDRGASVTVEDDGPGIPEGEAERIFDRFHRADPARSGPGHGLGLAIARSIVERHGGTITAPDSLERGATFILDLP